MTVGPPERSPEATRYQEHPIFSPPDDLDATIWRYIDFTKLVALLDRRALFFAAADRLGDGFEGSLSKINVALRPELYPKISSSTLEGLANARDQLRRFTFISCWNLSEHESAALWGLYVPPQGGVAVRSSFLRLTQSFPLAVGTESELDNRSIQVGQVRYANYEQTFIPESNMLWPFIYKRESFEFEREVRAVLQYIPTSSDQEEVDFRSASPPGHNIAVQLDRLIEAIHVSPVAPGWFADLVRSVCYRFELDKPVSQSSLAGQPVY